MEVVNDLSHLPTVRFDASSYDDVSRHISAWALLFRAFPVLRARGRVSLGGWRHAFLDYGRVVARMRTYLTVETPEGNVVVPMRRATNVTALTYTVGPA